MATTAFVLSGGGSLGAVQVGMLQALAARQIEPDLLIGTSAGALNAAFLAGHGTDADALDALAALWSGLRRRDVFPLRPRRVSAAAIGRAPSLCSPQPLRQLIAEHLPFVTLEQSTIPVHLVATDAATGLEVLLSNGDAVDAVLASAALPAVFPGVRIGDRDLFDGGIANNAAISQALELGADVVYVLPTGYACALDTAPTTALGSALHALTLLIEQRLIRDVAHFAPTSDIRVIPPLCPLNVPSIEFGYGALLIERARTSAGRWIDADGPARARPERFLSLHDHHINTHPGCRQGDHAA